MGTRETIHLGRFPLDNAICDRQHSGNKIDREDSLAGGSLLAIACEQQTYYR